jgi:hypothetical protein
MRQLKTLLVFQIANSISKTHQSIVIFTLNKNKIRNDKILLIILILFYKQNKNKNLFKSFLAKIFFCFALHIIKT